MAAEHNHPIIAERCGKIKQKTLYYGGKDVTLFSVYKCFAGKNRG